jgi:hypothetical protein
MAIKVAGRWELSWNTPIKEAELWNLVLRDFEIKDWYMWPVSGIRHNEEQSVHLHEYHDFKDILEDNKDIVHVYVEPNNPVYPHNGVDLRDFKHPKNVLYIFGSVGFNPIIGSKREKDLSVTIPTIQNKGVPWPHQCLFVVLYDRLVKGW